MGAIKDLRERCEEMAQHFLYRNGYDILDRNWIWDGDSVDFVATDEDGTLVFLDVLACQDGARGFPNEGSADAERGRFERVALAYMEEHPVQECRVRFDTLSCVPLGADRAFLKHHLGAYSVR